MKIFLYTIFGVLLAIGFSVYASAPIIQIINGGTGQSSFTANQLHYGNFGQVATTTVSCGTGLSCTGFTVIGSSPISITNTVSASVFPFTVNSWGNSTTTTLGFLNGFISTASSTISSTLNLPALSNGGLGVYGGLVYSGATTTAGIGLTYSGNAFNCNTASGSVFGCLNASDFSKFNSATTTFTSPLVYTGSTNAVTCPTCNVSGATLSSVGLSDSNSTLTIGSSPLTSNGTITATFNLGHTNTWSILQNFNYSSTTSYASFQTASTTSQSVGTLTIPNLGTSAGTFLAADPNGKVIATSTPTSSTGAISTSTTFSLPNNVDATVSKTVYCVSPKVVSGGGVSGITGASGVTEKWHLVTDNYPSASNAWTVAVKCITDGTNGCGNDTATVYAICVNP
jgi:hypothetical protein